MASKLGRRHVVPVVFGLVCALPVFGPSTASACPPPPTFSEEISYSDSIVIGRITGIEAKTTKITGEYEYEYTDEIATIEIEESLVGAVDLSAPLIVHEFGDLKADDAIHFMIFASRGDDGALNARLVRDVSDLGVRREFTDRVREFLAIRAIPEEDQREPFIEWVITCIEHDATRQDGIEELYQLGYSRWLPTPDGEEEERDPLTLGQRERLTTIMLSVDDERAMMGIAGFLSRYDDPRVSNHLVRVIELKSPSASDEVGWFMSMVSDQLHWRSGSWLADRYARAESRDERRAIVDKFLAMVATMDEVPEAAEPDSGDFADLESEAISAYSNAAAESEAAYERAATGEELEPEEPVAQEEVVEVEEVVATEAPDIEP